MKDDTSWKELARYYDERASEYDVIYAGQGPAFPNPEPYKEDVCKISKIISSFVKGKIIDIACGTGFWLPYYASNCTEITMLDQSEKMLEQARLRAKSEMVLERCRFIQGNFFKLKLEQRYFQSAIVGFLLSHLANNETNDFLTKLSSILSEGAELLIIDSSWSSERQKYRKKEEMQMRKLDDGREFSIFKRYFEIDELEHVLSQYGYHAKQRYFGNAFLTIVLELK